MSNALVAAITACAALGAASLTGAFTLKAAREGRRAASSGELATALAAFGHAADRLGLEISQLPPEPGRVSRWTTMLLRRSLPHADWAVGQLGRHTLARPALDALDAYMAAGNRLVLIAPDDVLEAVVVLNGLVERVADRDEKWRGDWQKARAALDVRARESVTA